MTNEQLESANLLKNEIDQLNAYLQAMDDMLNSFDIVTEGNWLYQGKSDSLILKDLSNSTKRRLFAAIYKELSDRYDKRVDQFKQL